MARLDGSSGQFVDFVIIMFIGMITQRSASPDVAVAKAQLFSLSDQGGSRQRSTQVDKVHALYPLTLRLQASADLRVSNSA